jgi:hypothetical protein
MLRVTVAAGRKGNFNRIVFSSDYHVHFQPVEVLALTEVSALTAVVSP